MLAVGVAIVTGGGVQTALLVAEGRAEHSAGCCASRPKRWPSLPAGRDQALVGEYAGFGQLLRNQVTKGEIAMLTWTDKDGKTLVGHDAPDKLVAPTGSRALPPSSTWSKTSRSPQAGWDTEGSLPP